MYPDSELLGKYIYEFADYHSQRIGSQFASYGEVKDLTFSITYDENGKQVLTRIICYREEMPKELAYCRELAVAMKVFTDASCAELVKMRIKDLYIRRDGITWEKLGDVLLKTSESYMQKSLLTKASKFAIGCFFENNEEVYPFRPKYRCTTAAPELCIVLKNVIQNALNNETSLRSFLNTRIVQFANEVIKGEDALAEYVHKFLVEHGDETIAESLQLVDWEDEGNI